jgi:TPR repeat protein
LSGRRASTTTAAATKPCWSRPREREATRLAILDVAHRLAELHGEAALTLSAVASEAGIARATIYGYFAGKRELLAQLNGEPPPEPEPPHEAEPAAAPEEEVPTPVLSEPDAPLQTDVPPPQEDKAVAAGGENARPSLPDDSVDYGEMMRRQAEELDKLAKRIIVPKTTLKEGTDGAISRLESRLRVVEQSVADGEARRSQDAREFADRIGSAVEVLQLSLKRLENSDNRQQQALAELRLDIHNLTSRAADVEREAAANATEPLEAAAFQATDFQPWKNSPACESAEPTQPSPESRQPDFLSSARRAAIDAAAATEEESAETGWHLPRWLWLFGAAIAAGAGLAIVLNMHSDVGVQPQAVSQLVAHGNRQPVNPPAKKRSVAALARAGNVDAQLILGLKLLNGSGAAMNIEKAAAWIERAAESGQPVAQETFGVLYQTGTGVAANIPKAMRWYEAAARSGNVKAMSNLGKAYAGGWSEGTDYAKAVQWFSRAASFGDVDAQFDLAILYERGEGVPRNLTDAYKWYSIAAKQGDRDAMEQLLPVYMRQASAAAERFKPSHANSAANDIPSLAAPIK